MPGLGRLGDLSKADVDAHGCPACPHSVTGPAVVGSPDVQVNNKPALRVGDNGIHAACCGPNTWTAITGSSTVFIDHLPAHRLNDMDLHCGGVGQLTQGSPDVIVGG
ncbi:MAG TPA: PAAR domain-containing protein [Candidatus Sulfotelmatobacter sp.]|nr:PAAR domain-containing protein [Candidatus Sulfotelmatobacter sp.]